MSNLPAMGRADFWRNNMLKKKPNITQNYTIQKQIV